jgi:hypothetical protein
VRRGIHSPGPRQRYVLRLTGRQPASGKRNGWPGDARLQYLLNENGRTLIDLAERADPDEVLRGGYQGHAYAMPVALIYVQAINRGTEHRSQLATIITLRGFEALDVLGWAWGQARGSAG